MKYTEEQKRGLVGKYVSVITSQPNPAIRTIRFVTKYMNENCFCDDGKLSHTYPSPSCHWEYYEELVN